MHLFFKFVRAQNKIGQEVFCGLPWDVNDANIWIWKKQLLKLCIWKFDIS